MNIKEVSPTYFGTSIPSSGSRVCHVQNQMQSYCSLY